MCVSDSVLVFSMRFATLLLQMLGEVEDMLPSERDAAGTFTPLNLAAELKVQVCTAVPIVFHAGSDRSVLLNAITHLPPGAIQLTPPRGPPQEEVYSLEMTWTSLPNEMIWAVFRFTLTSMSSPYLSHVQEMHFSESSAELTQLLETRSQSKCHTCPKLAEQYSFQQK